MAVALAKNHSLNLHLAERGERPIAGIDKLWFAIQQPSSRKSTLLEAPMSAVDSEAFYKVRFYGERSRIYQQEASLRVTNDEHDIDSR